MRRFLTSLTGLLIAATALSAQTVILNGELNDSKTYPGTRRTFKVSVPDQYDGSKPACLLVCMDGILFNAVKQLDTLMARGEVPTIIGVYVYSGTVYDDEGKVVRYNRSNEFDRTDGTFARFLEEEILPLAEAMTTPDGRKVRISHDPNDRAITGASSSGIAAFTAAWERPDLYSRVFSAVGTFVSMRGGNDYPALIRKSEPRRIRVFLQDGSNDAWNPLFGTWWEYNQLMADAFRFSGYEADWRWDEGGHDIKWGTLVFADAMRFLWKGWPERVAVGKSRNNMLTTILPDDASGWTEGTADNTAYADNTAASPDGTYICSKGSIKFKGAKGGMRKAVSATGENASNGSHIAVYPGGDFLVQSELNSNWLLSYIIGSDGSLNYREQFYWLHNRDNSNIDGELCQAMAFDERGNLYVATSMGIQVCDQNGRVRAILPLPYPFGTPFARIEALTFTPDGILSVRSGNRVCSRRLKVGGAATDGSAVTPKSQGQG